MRKVSYRREKIGYIVPVRTEQFADVGSGLTWTHQSDDRDSEPDYLLRPTRHGPGGTLLIIAHSFLERRSLKVQLGPKLGLKEITVTTTP